MLFIKGIVIGIGKIIPGVSGSMLAVSMGLYEKLINSINNFFGDFKKNFKFLFKIGLGIVISIIFFSNIILGLLNKYYLITIFLFIGLILGSLDDIKIKINKKNNYIVYIIFILVTILGLININNKVYIENSLLKIIYYFFAGVLDAITMIVPGISGTATLMMYGCYEDVIKSYSSILDISNVINNFSILFPFFIGMLMGIIFSVKAIDYLLKNKKEKTYSVIYGFCLSTIIIMGINGIKSTYNLLQLIIAFICMFLGYISIKKINQYFSND